VADAPASLRALQRRAGNRATAGLATSLAPRATLQRKILRADAAMLGNVSTRMAHGLLARALPTSKFGKWLVDSDDVLINFELVTKANCKPDENRVANTVYAVKGDKATVDMGTNAVEAFKAAGKPQAIVIHVQLFEPNIENPVHALQKIVHEITAHGAPLLEYQTAILTQHPSLEKGWEPLVTEGALAEDPQHLRIARGENAEYTALHQAVYEFLAGPGKSPRSAKVFAKYQQAELAEYQRLDPRNQ